MIYSSTQMEEARADNDYVTLYAELAAVYSNRFQAPPGVMF